MATVPATLGAGVTVIFTGWFTVGFTLSDSLDVKLAVPENPEVSVTVYVTFEVPCPPVTATFDTPVPAVADQLNILLSSVPVRPTVKGAESCATVVTGFAGAVIVGEASLGVGLGVGVGVAVGVGVGVGVG